MARQRAKGEGTVFRPKHSRFWWIGYTSGGRRRFESSKSTNKTKAQNLLRDRLGDIGKGIAVTPKMGRLKLHEGLKAVLDDLRLHNRVSIICQRCKAACNEEGHSNDAQRRVDHILRHLAAERLMTTIATADLRAYATTRLDEGASRASVNHELGMIRRGYRLAVQGGQLANAPHVPMLTLNNVRTGFFERDQFEAVRALLPLPLRGLATFAYLTGWRIRSELLPLRWSQVDRVRKTIRLETGTTKNREGRTLPYDLLPELATVIDEQWKAYEELKGKDVICPFVFHRNGKQIRDFRGAWEAACTAAGCPDKIVHDLRRTAVRNLVRAGVPEQTAMKITGHKTRSVFDRYDIVNEADLRSACGRLAEHHAQVDEQRSSQVAQFQPRAAAAGQ